VNDIKLPQSRTFVLYWKKLDTMKKTQRPRHVLVSDDEDETTAKRRFLAESGVVEAERKTSGVSVSCSTASIS
jgi:hypothetical protein